MANNDDQGPIRIRRSNMKVKYPHNWVYLSRSGHEIHVDDTQGKERIRVAHKDGAYWELSSGGKSTMFIPGGNQQYNKSGLTVTTDGHVDNKGNKHMRVNISGGQHFAILGDADMVVAGNMNSVVGGNQASAVKGKTVILADGPMLMHTKGDFKVTAEGGMKFKASGDIAMNGATIKLNS